MSRIVHLYNVFYCIESTSDWNPMQSDYLSRRNNYIIDDEDVGCAFDGYSK